MLARMKQTAVGIGALDASKATYASGVYRKAFVIRQVEAIKTGQKPTQNRASFDQKVSISAIEQSITKIA